MSELIKKDIKGDIIVPSDSMKSGDKIIQLSTDTVDKTLKRPLSSDDNDEESNHDTWSMTASPSSSSILTSHTTRRSVNSQDQAVQQNPGPMTNLVDVHNFSPVTYPDPYSLHVFNSSGNLVSAPSSFNPHVSSMNYPPSCHVAASSVPTPMASFQSYHVPYYYHLPYYQLPEWHTQQQQQYNRMMFGPSSDPARGQQQDQSLYVPERQELYDDGNHGTASSPSAAATQQCLHLPVSKSITVESVRPLFHKSLAEAAQHFGICSTLFKKVCRRLNIKKWPYRQINCLANRVDSLEHSLAQQRNLPEMTKISYREQIAVMKERIEKIKNDSISPSADGKPAPTGSTERSPSSEPRESHIGSSHVGQQLSSIVVSASGSITKSKRRKIGDEAVGVNNHRTNWVARCSNCGMMGPYHQHPGEQLRPHVLESGQLCGHFCNDPRLLISDYNGNQHFEISTTHSNNGKN